MLALPSDHRLDQHGADASDIGLAFLHDKDEARAARMFEYTRKDCANYQPAAAMLAQCYESLGETQ